MNFIIQILIAIAILAAIIIGIGFITNRKPKTIVKDTIEDFNNL